MSLKPRARCLNGSAGYPKCVDEISPPLSRPVGFVACMELHAHHGWWLPEAFRATDLRPVLFILVFPINCLVGSVLSLSFRESPPHICHIAECSGIFASENCWAPRSEVAQTCSLHCSPNMYSTALSQILVQLYAETGQRYSPWTMLELRMAILSLEKITFCHLFSSSSDVKVQVFAAQL